MVEKPNHSKQFASSSEKAQKSSVPNVGIGTTAPLTKLDIRGSANDEVTAAINLYNGTAGNTAAALFTPQSDTASGAFGTFSGSYSNAALADRVAVRAEGNASGITIGATAASGDIQLYTGGWNERLRVTSTGNVGIGTTNPSSKLVVQDSGGAGILALKGNDPGAAIAAPYISSPVTTGFSPVAVYSFWWQSGTGISNPADSVLGITTSGTERLRVSSTGNVGIGTSSPNAAAVLDVNGTGNLSAMIVPRATTADRPVTAANGMIRYNTNTSKFEVYTAGSWADVATGASSSQWTTTGSDIYYSTGNIGVGTSTVVDKITVRGTDQDIYAHLTLSNPTAGRDVGFKSTAYKNTTSSAPVFQGTTYRGSSGAPAAVQTGDVLLNIQGAGGNGSGYNVNTGARIVLTAEETFSTSTAASSIAFRTAATGDNFSSERMRIQPDGSVGIGTVSASQALHVVGNMEIEDNNPKFVFDDNNGNDVYLQNANGDLRFSRNDDATINLLVEQIGRIGIGTTSPNAAAVLDVNGTGNLSAMIVPRATTAERPVTAANGMIRYNTNTSKFEVYAAGNWADVSTGAAGGSQWVDGAGGDIYYNGGSVGIGITNPTAAFEIDHGTGTGRAAYIYSSTGATADNPLVNLYTSNSAFDQAALDVTYNGTSEAVGIYNSGSSAGLYIGQNGNSRGAYVYSNIGASANDPLVEIQANNAAYDQPAMLINNYGAGSSFRVNDVSGDTTPFIIDNAGNVGIGTTSITQKLTVVDSNSGSTMAVKNSAATGWAELAFKDNGDVSRGYIGFGNSSSPDPDLNQKIYLDSNAAPISFLTNGNQVLEITTSQTVGIGTTSPATGAILDINGTGVNFSSVIVPRGTTAQRAGTGVNGMIRYNDNTSNFEGYMGGQWRNLNASGVAVNAGAYSGTISVSMAATNFVRLSAAASNCGTLDITNTRPGETYTVSITNASDTCTINWNGAATNVKTPQGYSNSLTVNGVVYTFYDDGASLWVTNANY